ncbi:MAG: GNAT family N-acetyltransferase [Chloroflexota bacterium]
MSDTESSLSVRTIDNIQDIDELQNILDTIGANLEMPSKILAPSLRTYWLLSFVKAYGSSRKLAITVVFEDGFPRLIMPLQCKNDTCLEFLCDETSDYNDFFYGRIDVELFKYAWMYWISRGIKRIFLYRLPPDSKTIELFSAISAEIGLEIEIKKCDSLPVVITQPEKEIQNWEGVKRHSIKRYKRKQNALARIADISFSFIETQNQLIELFPEIRHLHITRWELNNVYSKYLDPKREAFIINICKTAIEDSSLFFPIMKINGVLAAYIIGFRYGETIFDWNTSFSVDYFQWSPGALLLLHILSNSKKFGYSKYNLLKGLESYKFIWTNIIEDNLSLLITVK